MANDPTPTDPNTTTLSAGDITIERSNDGSVVLRSKAHGVTMPMSAADMQDLVRVYSGGKPLDISRFAEPPQQPSYNEQQDRATRAVAADRTATTSTSSTSTTSTSGDPASSKAAEEQRKAKEEETKRRQGASTSSKK